MKKYLPVLVFILFVFPSCMMGQNKNEILQNDKIAPQERTAISALNKQVFKAISENNYDNLSKLMTDTMKLDVSNDFVKKFIPQIQGVIKGRNYRIFDEYYFKTIKPSDTIKIASGKGDNAYTMDFITKYKETYMSMLISGDSLDEVMLTVIYIKINGKWKMDYLSGEDYSLNRRNAIEQYNYAQRLQKEGSLIDAVNVIALSEHCNNPGGKAFKYKKAKEIKDFSDSLTAETKAKYTFPYTVNELATKPSVFSIHYEMMNHNFAMMFYYQSVINVMDTISLKKENQETVKKIKADKDRGRLAQLREKLGIAKNNQ